MIPQPSILTDASSTTHADCLHSLGIVAIRQAFFSTSKSAFSLLGLFPLLGSFECDDLHCLSLLGALLCKPLSNPHYNTSIQVVEHAELLTKAFGAPTVMEDGWVKTLIIVV